MIKLTQVLEKVRESTDSVLLFSSINGKDSLLLTHYCSEIFPRTICVFMYIVKDLESVNKYKYYLMRRYSNIEFMEVPHFSLSHHIRMGFLGMKQDKKYKIHTLAMIDAMVREKTGLSWSIYGSKKNDGLNRRLQLNTYPDLICHASNKAYPLGDYSNNQIISLLDMNGLPYPISYSNDRSQSTDIKDLRYLLWLYENYPQDLEKITAVYPGVKAILYEHFYKAERIEREV